MTLLRWSESVFIFIISIFNFCKMYEGHVVKDPEQILEGVPKEQISFKNTFVGFYLLISLIKVGLYDNLLCSTYRYRYNVCILLLIWKTCTFLDSSSVYWFLFIHVIACPAYHLSLGIFLVITYLITISFCIDLNI